MTASTAISTTASTVVSADGTRIAFTRTGEGPAVILVDGALCSREFGPLGKLAAELNGRFTVYTYDRRGRGESGDAPSYDPAREIEDLAALIEEAGGSAHVCGVSSGAALALEAARRGLPIGRLALYEAPFIVDDSRTPVPDDYVAALERAVAAGRPGDAVRYFMRFVGMPAVMVAMMRFMPGWSKLKKVAHTLPYDGAFVNEFQKGRPLPAGRWASVTVPTAVIDGGKSPAWMRNANAALAAGIPGAAYRTLPGQTHMVKAGALAPALTRHFTA
ncbi:alpha/beta fold hydrolase [Actinoallomurus rhizosphaericola]|uniref:alpha/beta fold hydrolase n=1 Tax=Actinoallomurus rhizosphaericola TaxID=2952536 RepID=UPI00209380A8|nr:alpha/beta hydrolase [Actinoallomurus rhizosphaericola]MCO5999672.1 alpha/beta hydrolase [Actinoallomurus rhizosphaericola]